MTRPSASAFSSPGASGFCPAGEAANAFSAASVPSSGGSDSPLGVMNGTAPGGGGSGCSYGSNDGASRRNAKIGTDASALSMRVQPLETRTTPSTRRRLQVANLHLLHVLADL